MSKRIVPRTVAVFDIDGTIFRSSLLIEVVEALIGAGVFPENARAQYARAYHGWLDRKSGYDKYIIGVIRAFERHIKGVRRRDFVRIAKKVAAFHQNRVYRYTSQLVRDLKKKNFYLLAISHSPKYIVEEFAKRIGFDKVYGRLLALDAHERFTGKVLNAEVIDDKEKVLRRALLKEQLMLAGSVGVGDSESDIAFLKLVEHPICLNPNRVLYAHAKKRGWQVVVERKDVIYDLRENR